MEEIIKFNKSALIDELRQIHKDMVSVYGNLFKYKYEKDVNFKSFIENEHKENGISKDKTQEWNDNFCHRASYTLINKILFIRICEDKGFMLNPEDYILGEAKDINIGKKLSARGRDKWISLISNYTLGELLQFAFEDMRESFKNIALYKEDKYEKLNPFKFELEYKFKMEKKDYEKTPFFNFEEEVAAIIEKLDTSKFDFDIPSEGNILGDVYEKFMDRESRKAIGQFYTPDYIIEYILNSTVANVDVVENPFVSVLDPACGSGHFLIMAYDILRKKFEDNLDILREKYTETEYRYKSQVLKGSEYWINDRIHYHILKNCIYGSDIDSFAIQLTTINLLLKDLDNFTDDLNIMECDSLIKREQDYQWKELEEQLEHQSLFFTIKYTDIDRSTQVENLSIDRAKEIIKLCKFWEKEYDYIVGNPPYGSKINDESLKSYYMTEYNDVHMRTIDVYNYFISRATKKTHEKLGFIIPNSLLTQYEYTDCRKYLIDNYDINQVIYMGENVFEDNSYPTMILILQKNRNDENIIKLLDVSNLSNNIEKKLALDDMNKKCIMTNQNIFRNVDQYKFLLIQENMINLVFKIKSNHKRLDDISTCVSVGIASGNDKAFAIEESNINNIDKKLLKRLLVGGNIAKYTIGYANKYIIYIGRDTDVSDCGNTIHYLEEFKGQLSKRREAQKGIMRWFELHWPRNLELFESNKVICRQTGDSLIATVDKNNYYTLNSIINIIIKEADKKDFSEEYVAALLNSRVMNAYYKLIVQENNKLYAEVKPVVLKELPVPKIEYNQLVEINKKVTEIIGINNKINEIDINLSENILINFVHRENNILRMKSEIKKADEYLNDLIYKIFNLDKGEIELIEMFLFGKVLRNKCLSNNIANTVTVEELINHHMTHNKTIEEIADIFEMDYYEMISLREKFVQEHCFEKPWMMYNLRELYNAINNHLKNSIVELLSEQKSYLEFESIRKKLEFSYSNFEELMTVMKKDIYTKKSKEIVKETINIYSVTWNAYIKNKKLSKKSNEIIKYYDNNYYGLSEWDDEVHKEYFIYAMKEYTEISPNEKKAKDILKLFEGLNVKDKEDYIDMFNLQIKKAFKK